jgi:hypothetical protein
MRIWKGGNFGEKVAVTKTKVNGKILRLIF